MAILLWQFSATARVKAINTAFWLEARLRPLHLTATLKALGRWLPPGAVILAGDSLIALLPERRIGALAVNIGLGGATVTQIRAVLGEFDPAHRARALVLLVGTNDLVHSDLPTAEAQLRALLAELPPHLHVLLCTVPPVDPAVHGDRNLVDIARLNQRWAACAAARPNTQLVTVEAVLADATGRLSPNLHAGDGLHLNAEGNRRLAALLREALGNIRP